MGVQDEATNGPHYRIDIRASSRYGTGVALAIKTIVHSHARTVRRW